MTKIQMAGITAEIKGGLWESESKGFENWLNGFASADQVEGHAPNLEVAMLNAAKKLFKNIEVLEPPKPVKYESGDFVY
jgi:hypothetical protein